MGYKYETHLHTRLGSACGRSMGSEHVRYYKSLGYTGVFITEHFWRGNAAPDRSMPWRDWVDALCRGYEDALEEGKKIGLDVFFAWEETINGDDYLIYGLDRQFLYDHPEARFWSYEEQYRAVHDHGGCVIQAHPYRVRDYIHKIYLNPMVDGVEVANAGNECFSDVHAYRYAKENGFYMTAGSDNHLSREGLEAEGRIFGVELEEKLTSEKDFVRVILEKKPCKLLCPEDRFDARYLEQLPLEVCHIPDTYGMK